MVIPGMRSVKKCTGAQQLENKIIWQIMEVVSKNWPYTKQTFVI